MFFLDQWSVSSWCWSWWCRTTLCVWSKSCHFTCA